MTLVRISALASAKPWNTAWPPHPAGDIIIHHEKCEQGPEMEEQHKPAPRPALPPAGRASLTDAAPNPGGRPTLADPRARFAPGPPSPWPGTDPHPVRPAQSPVQAPSVLIAANRAFGGWNWVFPDPAMRHAGVERRVRHATILVRNVDSCRRHTAAECREGHGQQGGKPRHPIRRALSSSGPRLPAGWPRPLMASRTAAHRALGRALPFPGRSGAGRGCAGAGHGARPRGGRR